MTNPRTLLLAIAATACGLLLTLVGASGLATTTVQADPAAASVRLAAAGGVDCLEPAVWTAAGKPTRQMGSGPSLP